MVLGKPVEDYIFLRIPVNPGSVSESSGSVAGSINADSTYFRYVAAPTGMIVGPPQPNVRVGFVVVGYKPEDLLGLSEEKSLGIGV